MSTLGVFQNTKEGILNKTTVHNDLNEFLTQRALCKIFNRINFHLKWFSISILYIDIYIYI